MDTRSVSRSRVSVPATLARGGAPFICIARQTGINTPTLSATLADALNQLGPMAPVWKSWDNELLTKVASEMHIPIDRVEQSEGPYSWIDDVLSTLAERTDQMAVFHRLSHAVRTLAGNGGAIFVGHGSHFITRGMPGGIHVRLVSPWPMRVQTIAQTFNLPSQKAERKLRQLHRNRIGFFKRYWPDYRLDPEGFSATLNAGFLTEAQLVSAITAVTPVATTGEL